MTEALCRRTMHRAADFRGMAGMLGQQRLAATAQARAPRAEPVEMSAEWVRVRNAIVDALGEYPEARAAVVRVLEGL
ncbi:MAG: hypothetical protein R2762_21925 [Bryobacteraceae bacterium]